MRWNLGFVVAISNKCRPCVAFSRRHTWEWPHLVAKFRPRFPVRGLSIRKYRRSYHPLTYRAPLAMATCWIGPLHR
jgi:hypothetical protein